MTMRDPNPLRRARGAAGACLLLILAHSGCGLDEVKIPGLSGPSELATALRLTANPDVITADGFSTSLIQVQVFDENGSAAAGRVILLAISDSTFNSVASQGNFADLGTLNSTSGSLLRAAEATVVSDGSGVATAIYTAPARTDFTANGTVTIAARPVGTDANGVFYRSVKIELKSAEPKLFPAPPGTLACGFVVEAPQGSTTCTDARTCSVKVNTGVLFQDASVGDIVRYDWYFGDGSPNEDSPDTNHVFRTVGTFTVTHRVTDRAGAAVACSGAITVSP